AIFLDRPGGDDARAQDAPEPRQQALLEPGIALALGTVETGLERERVMDEAHEPQPRRRLRRQAFGESGQGQAIDDGYGIVGERGEHGGGGIARRRVAIREAARQLADVDAAARCAQAVDDAAVEEIAAGQLVERTRHDESKRRHGSGPSKAAQATGDSRSVTRIPCSAPAVSGPRAPWPMR